MGECVIWTPQVRHQYSIFNRHELSPPDETGGEPCPYSHIWLEDRREYRHVKGSLLGDALGEDGSLVD